MTEKSWSEQFQEEFVSQGFYELDPKVVTHMPPKIKWGEEYVNSFSDERKISYLEKLSASMNHAAKLLQDERDQLAELCDKKERQLESMKTALGQNNSMMQQLVTSMNAKLNAAAEEVARLNAKIRGLEKTHASKH